MLWDVTSDSGIGLLPVVLILLYLSAVVLSTVTTGVYFQYRKSVLPAAIITAHLAFCVVGCLVFFFFSSVMWLWSAKYSLTRPMKNWRLSVGLWGICLFKDVPLLIVEVCAIFQTGWHDSGLQAATLIVQMVLAIFSITTTSVTFSWYAAGFLDRNFGVSSEPIVPGRGRGRVPYAAQMAAVAAAGRPPPLMLQEVRIPVWRMPMSAPASRQVSPRRWPRQDNTEPSSRYSSNRVNELDWERSHALQEPPVRHHGPPQII